MDSLKILLPFSFTAYDLKALAFVKQTYVHRGDVKITLFFVYRGCNLAFWKNDFEKVNGFDERYEGWGREDSDILIRLIRSGVMRKDTRFATPLLHLWHPEKSANDEVQNNPLLDNILDSSEIEAKVGLNKYM